jgi:hypothetical protein
MRASVCAIAATGQYIVLDTCLVVVASACPCDDSRASDTILKLSPWHLSPLVITSEVITLEMGPNNNKAQKFNAQTSSLRAHDRDASLDPRSLARFILGTGTDGTSGGSCFSLFTVHTVILGKVAPAAIGFYRSMADSYIAVVRAS